MGAKAGVLILWGNACAGCVASDELNAAEEIVEVVNKGIPSWVISVICISVSIVFYVIFSIIFDNHVDEIKQHFLDV